MTQKNEQYLRHNKNFLEKPMFSLDEVNANQEKHCWAPIEGFRIETDYKLPTKTDQVLLYFLMLRSQAANWQTGLVFSKHELLKHCGICANKKSYARLDDTLERWFRIRVYYENSFVCTEKGRTYKINGAFHILDSYDYQKQNQEGRTKVHIRLSASWLDVVRTHAFFELLDFQVIKKISSPLGLRLYEILSKNFYNRDVWKIDSMKLAAMIPLKTKYASDCIKKIKPLINKINEAYGVKLYSLKIKKPCRGVAILSFHKNTNAAPSLPDMPFPGRPTSVPGACAASSPAPMLLFDEDRDVFDGQAYMNALPPEEQDALMDEFEASLNNFNRKRYMKKGLEGMALKGLFNQFCQKHSKK